jgi:Nitrous oxide reductase
MSEYIEEYKGYKMMMWTETYPETNKLMLGGEYQVKEVNRIWHFTDKSNLRALFYEAVDKEENKMNWQTKEIQDWLKRSAILYVGHNANQIEDLVEDWLLERFDGSPTNVLKRLITLDFLRKVEWEKLVVLPETEERIEQKLEEYRKRFKEDET